MVRMVNEYGSAYKTVRSREDMEDLLASGWTIVEEKVVTPEPTVPPDLTVTVVDTHAEMRNQLIYKNRYLTQWVQTGTKPQLRDIFDYFGIPYSHDMRKSDMQIALRKYIREAKAEKRRQQNDGE